MTDDTFFDVIRSMPFREADEELRRRRHDALQRRLLARIGKDGIEEDRLNILLTRLNDELHRINRINRDFQLQVAIRTLFGDEGWEQVKVWMLQNHPEAA